MVGLLHREDWEMITDDGEKMELLHSYFASAFSHKRKVVHLSSCIEKELGASQLNR